MKPRLRHVRQPPASRRSAPVTEGVLALVKVASACCAGCGVAGIDTGTEFCVDCIDSADRDDEGESR